MAFSITRLVALPASKACLYFEAIVSQRASKSATPTIKNKGIIVQDHTIIFDLDGTLANTGPDLLEALNYSIEPEGLKPLSIDHLGHLVGHGSLAMIKRAYAIYNVPITAEIEQNCQTRFLDYYGQNISKNTRLFPGAQKALDALNNFTLSVCTNKQEHLARQLLKELGIIDKFKSITGGDSFDFRKPDGRHLTKTVELANGRLNSGAVAKTIMIGDTVTDTKAAQNAGIPVIVVDFGYSDVPVSTLNADIIISHFDDLIPAINQLITTNG